MTLFGLWLAWPMPIGGMPLSADHTVHLTRIWMWAEGLTRGELRGWSDIWFFGTPVGELYPVLGDALVVGFRAMSLGLLDWPQAYALGITLVLLAQAWALMRFGRVLGMGVAPGTIAALLVLCDVGAYREGGWTYTIGYGVWPQALANALNWFALAELVLAVDATAPLPRARAIVRGAIAIAGALLAHPVSAPVLVIELPIAIAVLARGRWRELGRTTAIVAGAAAIGVALSAWWLVPAASMRGWAASYGWLWMPLSRMLQEAWRGHITQAMPAWVSLLVAVGLATSVVTTNRAARMAAAIGVALWIAASEDVFWTLRLDHLSAGFAQVQWQRFLIAAKPGLMLAAGTAVGLAIALTRGLWRSGRRPGRPLAIALATLTTAAIALTARAQLDSMRRHGVGVVQRARDPDDPSLDHDYAALLAHLRELDDKDNWRMTVAAPRNLHWFMDAPLTTGIPLYKQGFTPADNFVHKPEANTPALLDRLGVRFVVTRGRGAVRNAELVASFGALRLWERDSWRPQPRARLEGIGALEVIADDRTTTDVRVRVHGSGAGDRLVFDVAGYPRWELVRDGIAVDWYEVPAIGDGPIATLQMRMDGELRGGKADGDDGSEPTLIAADATDGVYELRFRRWLPRDVAALLVSVFAAAGSALALLGLRRERAPRWLSGLTGAATRLRPWMVVGFAALVLALACVRWLRGAAMERGRASAWVADGRADAYGLSAGPLKTDMLVRAAVIAPRRRNADPAQPAIVVFEDIRATGDLRGWVALDDDAARMPREGRHRLRIEVRTRASDQEWTVAFEEPIPHRAGRRMLVLDRIPDESFDLRVSVFSEGDAPPLGFDLELAGGEP